MSGFVLAIGAMLMDTKGKPVAGLEPGTSNTARIRTTFGGTARNVAENLGRLGAEVVLMSAVGGDDAGERLIAATQSAGVDTRLVLRRRHERTGSYMAVLEEDGSLAVALDDVHISKAITPARLEAQRDYFRRAAIIVVDGSLTPEALATAVELARAYRRPICADPSSTRLAPKLIPHLAALALAVPNEAEAFALCGREFEGESPDNSLQAARHLVGLGVETAVVTLSDFGLAYATSDETGHIPARYSRMIDSTGTGDAITAATIFGLLNDMAVTESLRLGAAAAGLTLQSEESVVPDLSLDALYEHLIV